MLMQHCNASEKCLIPMMSKPDSFTLLFCHFSMMTVSSEIFNPSPFILGIERPDPKLFMSITNKMISKRETLLPNYHDGLNAVTILLSKAAPFTDLYFCLRDHPLQNPTKAKVHFEHGSAPLRSAALRLAVKVYLDVSFYWIFPPIYVQVLILY